MTANTPAPQAPSRIRYKIQCPGIIGHENRAHRSGSGALTLPPERRIGTFLFHTQTQAATCTATLRRLGYHPKMVKL